ncbi:hypothetical protein LUZ60_000731 [Juncus effusus]|nr:hypothetical protein LUZ60_000731 [Juncus effusus]
MAEEERELKLDLEELRRLCTVAKRPRVLSLLSSEIRNLDAQLSKISASAISSEKAPVTISLNPPALNYITLGSFSWDQDDDKIRIYVFLEGVEQDKVESSFAPTSIEVKFHEVKGKNYKCAIPKLNKEIDPQKCKVLVKPTKVVVTLFKASKGNWLDLHFKEDKIKPSLYKDTDPMAGIMNLMKDMYEEGDDDMKRTIANAYMDARSKNIGFP